MSNLPDMLFTKHVLGLICILNYTQRKNHGARSRSPSSQLHFCTHMSTVIKNFILWR